jgi:hypothetical protein
MHVSQLGTPPNPYLLPANIAPVLEIMTILLSTIKVFFQMIREIPNLLFIYHQDTWWPSTRKLSTMSPPGGKSQDMTKNK